MPPRRGSALEIMVRIRSINSILRPYSGAQRNAPEILKRGVPLKLVPSGNTVGCYGRLLRSVATVGCYGRLLRSVATVGCYGRLLRAGPLQTRATASGFCA